ncbi:MAG: efflux RND transporter periplasmic adaptor subunit [Gammaproteobacteria bacterium]|nr:efflux RND transporter periplasmic adaptor subunit [Gammaproteobacteria bacterium]
MKIRSTHLGLLVLPLLLLVGGCNNDSEAKDAKSEDAKPKVPVEVARIFRGDIQASWEGSATLRAEEDAMVVAKVAGVVEEILFEEGQPVRSGQVLARLETDRLRLEVERARANMEKLENDFARNQRLFKKKLVSPEVFDRVRFELASQKAAWNLARLNLSESEIRSPINGVVAERHIRVGNMIQPNESAFRVTRFNPLLAEVHVPERDSNKFSVGQDVDVRVDGWPETVFRAHVLRTSPIVAADTGTVKITVEVSDERARLKPGMFARVWIHYDRHSDVLLAPRDALLNEDAKTAMFRISDGSATRVEVRSGYSDEQFVEIENGLDLDDLVVTTGQGTLKDGAKVDLVNAAAMGIEEAPAEKEDEKKGETESGT